MDDLQFTIEQKRLSSAEAELWVIVHVDELKSSLEIRGQLSGPKCPNVQTVQIAYPIKGIHPKQDEKNVLIGRIIIPEPNVWSPEMPFVYEGTVELWEDEKRIGDKPVRLALKAKN
ncbi:MAG: hypothetical protein K8T89_10375 [Planctomycetes bacterium]|nr:hypothetical protein [Planctomycetota bacterium]